MALPSFCATGGIKKERHTGPADCEGFIISAQTILEKSRLYSLQWAEAVSEVDKQIGCCSLPPLQHCYSSELINTTKPRWDSQEISHTGFSVTTSVAFHCQLIFLTNNSNLCTTHLYPAVRASRLPYPALVSSSQQHVLSCCLAALSSPLQIAACWFA